MFALCFADQTRAGDPAADDAAGWGDPGNERDLFLPAAGGGAQDKEAEEGKTTLLRGKNLIFIGDDYNSTRIHCVQLYAKVQLLKGDMRDIIDEHVRTRQELEQTQNELTRELKYKWVEKEWTHLDVRWTAISAMLRLWRVSPIADISWLRTLYLQRKRTRLWTGCTSTARRISGDSNPSCHLRGQSIHLWHISYKMCLIEEKHS